MENNEQFSDWLIRYDHFFSVRYTKKQKQKFLQSFLTDLTHIRKDVELRGDKEDKYSYHAVVGDLNKAKYVIATYYDTPAVYQGSYHYFDTDDQRKKTIRPLLVYAIALLLIGGLFTYFISIPFLKNDLLSFKTLLFVIGYFIYFKVLGKASQGWPNRKNLIRNNSSLLLLLSYIANKKSDSKFAFVFFDNGSQGEHSIHKVLNKLNSKKQSLLILDSVGSGGQLALVSKQKFNGLDQDWLQLTDQSIPANCYYIITTDDQGPQFSEVELSKDALKAKDLNQENLTKVNRFLERLERR